MPSESEWDALVNDFISNAEKFTNQVEQMEDQLFDQPFIDEKYGTFLRNIEVSSYARKDPANSIT